MKYKTKFRLPAGVNSCGVYLPKTADADEFEPINIEWKWRERGGYLDAKVTLPNGAFIHSYNEKFEIIVGFAYGGRKWRLKMESRCGSINVCVEETE